MFRRTRRSSFVRPVLAAEALEDRRLLAVTVTASGTTAKIIGDSNDDHVILNFRNFSAGPGTSLNVDQSYTNNRNNITTFKFEMKGGNDTVEIDGLFNTKLVTVIGGAGDNNVQIEDSHIVSLIINNGTGEDTNVLRRVQIGPDGNSNGGKLTIFNGNGSSTNQITSSGPGSGFSMHTSKVSITNGEGNHDVEFANIRMRKAAVTIKNGAGHHNTTFSNVDKLKSIKVTQTVDFIGITGGSQVNLEDTQIESGGISVVSSPGTNSTSTTSALTTDDGTVVAKSVVHKASTLFSFTQIADSQVKGNVQVSGKELQGTLLTIFDGSLVEGNVSSSNRFSSTPVSGFPQLSSVRLEDSIFEGNVKVQDTGSALLTGRIDTAIFQKNLIVKRQDGGGELELMDAGVGGNFAFTAQTGNDEVKIDDSIFNKKVTIKTGGSPIGVLPDEDKILIEQKELTGAGTEFRGPVNISTGVGSDEVRISGDDLFPIPTRVATFRHKSVKLSGGSDKRDAFLFDVDELFLGNSDFAFPLSPNNIKDFEFQD